MECHKSHCSTVAEKLVHKFRKSFEKIINDLHYSKWFLNVVRNYLNERFPYNIPLDDAENDPFKCFNEKKTKKLNVWLSGK